jgi:cytochrome c peroxidase
MHMQTRIWTAFGLAGCFACTAQTGDDTEPTPLLDDTERAFLSEASPLPDRPPASPTNAYADDASAAALGQKWFFDERFSGPVGASGQGHLMPAPTSPPAELIAAVGPQGTAGLVSCGTCHSFDNGAMGDDRKSPNHVSLGTGVHPRNAPPIVNSSYYEVVNWAGRFAAQWELPPAVAENPRTMNASRIYLAQQIWKNYRDEYRAVFEESEHGNDGGDALMSAVKLKIAAFNAAQNPPITGDELSGATIPAGKPKAKMDAPDGLWESLSAEEKGFVNRVFTNFGKAIEAYQRKLIARESPFDRWVSAGFDDTISLEARRGAKVFIEACGDCHFGPMFSDFEFHNVGLTQLVAEHVPSTEGVGAMPLDGSDAGRFADGDAQAKASGLGGATPGISVSSKWSDDMTAGAELIAQLGATTPMPEEVRGAFRTPSLRNIAKTAPYMHAGQHETIAEVIEFYDRGGDIDFLGSKDSLIEPLALTAEQKSDLAAFLDQLTSDEAIPAALLDAEQ